MGPNAAIFGFENLADLDFVPIAGRRSLDHAGLRMTLEGWRSLAFDDRHELTTIGGQEVVDVARAVAIASRAVPPPTRVEPAPDPDQVTPPDELLRALDTNRPLDGPRWASLRGLDRYALSYVHRRAVARGDVALLRSAYDDIFRITPRPARATSTTSFPAALPRPPAEPRKSPFPQTDDTPTRAVDVPHRTTHPPPSTSRSSSPAMPAVRPRRGTNPDPVPVVAAGGLSDLDRTPKPPELTHASANGAVHMVDVSPKPTTSRRASAQAIVQMRPETLARLEDAPKGAVLATARVAGIQAAKRTSELIPLCHMLPLTSVEVELHPDPILGQLQIVSVVRAIDRTGVEMEALVAVSIAALTVYDMLKAIDREIVVADVRLLEKDGGASGSFRAGAS